jgi:hypothetical protein
VRSSGPISLDTTADSRKATPLESTSQRQLHDTVLISIHVRTSHFYFAAPEFCRKRPRDIGS